MHWYDNIVAKFERLGVMLISPGALFSIPTLLSAFCVAFVFLYLRQRRRHGHASVRAILRGLLAKRLLFNASTYADIQYFFINSLALGGLIGWGLFSFLKIAGFTTYALNAAFGARTPSTWADFWLRAVATLTLFLAYEFGYWLDHYLKHRIPALWELHKPHHTAEVLTPLTQFRVHPLDTLVFDNVLALCTGVAAGVVDFSFGRPAPIYQVDGQNVILVAFIYAYIHLQHSEVWIPFRGLLGRLLMSPAHHQIHHSIDPAHYNRNLGSCLAVWDWLFGTLTMPEKETQRLTFGVVEDGKNPHTLTALLLDPLAGSAKAALKPPMAPPPLAAVPPDAAAIAPTRRARQELAA